MFKGRMSGSGMQSSLESDGADSEDTDSLKSLE